MLDRVSLYAMSACKGKVVHVGQISGEDFVVATKAGDVPCTVWLPAGVNDAPIVLVGHGGGGHRRTARNERCADILNSAGIACLAIDGPFHGDRRIAGDDALDYQQRVVAEGPLNVHQRMRQDWLRALSAVVDNNGIDGDRVGFLGMSMGARYGLMTCAALGVRLQCAVLGKFGLQCRPAMATQAADALIETAARTITAPVLWHVQRDDDIFPLEGQLELYDLLASPGKQIRARAGSHSASHPDDEKAWCAYLTRHLLSR